MSEQEEIQATLAEHRAWTWNRFKEEHGPHVIGHDWQNRAVTHVFTTSGDRVAMCGTKHPQHITFFYTMACWPTCKACASKIYNLCTTSLPEVVSVQSEVSGTSGQLDLPGSETWGTMKRNGLTLIELIVVVLMVAMLAAILFPVFLQVREKLQRRSLPAVTICTLDPNC